ncbi:fimbrillin family protein [Dysgonomonas sp. Marseille-P4677]|uniref:fimbrillin family protein n=1 Tax=Dysgonomonas sp. Marseille-P4677 TaxID=2364790 RepID=UPI0019132063|nr:fimbrillin family protein [Dysgonomonas sp. Marseille-P4677]MBK5720793.1 fimbrillin family protein [Dysgonomonas sp. Marseille-P4677]
MRKILPIVFITVLALTACSNDEEVDNSRKEVKIVATIGATDGKTKAVFENDGSGVFETGDRYTLIYKHPTEGNESKQPYEIGITNLYWEDLTQYCDNSTVFFAWYPHFFYDGIAVPYKVAGAETEVAKDLLMAPPVTVAKGDPVNLQFKHVMHKLVIVLSSSLYSAAELDNAVITLKNLKSDAIVNFLDCTVDETAAEGTDSYTPKTGASVSFIVAPQVLPAAGTGIIEIEIAGKSSTYKVSSGLTRLERGKALTLNLTLKEGGYVSGYVEEDFTPDGGWDEWN